MCVTGIWPLSTLVGFTEEILHKPFYKWQLKPSSRWTFPSLRIVYASKTKWQINDPTSLSLLTTNTLLLPRPLPLYFTGHLVYFLKLLPMFPPSFTQFLASYSLHPAIHFSDPFPIPPVTTPDTLPQFSPFFLPIPTPSLKGLVTLPRKSPFFFSEFHSLTIHSSYVSCPSSEGLQCVRVFLYKVDAFGVQGRSDGWSDKLRSILLIPGLRVDLGEVTLLALSAGIGINAALLCSEKKFVSWGLTLLPWFPAMKGLFVGRSSLRSIFLAVVSLTEMSATFSSKRFVELVDRAVRSIEVISDDESHSLYAVLAGKIDSSPLA